MATASCCAYCNHEIEVPNDYVTANEDPPDADDDPAWALIAKEHSRRCEWVETRAHRRIRPSVRLGAKVPK